MQIKKSTIVRIIMLIIVLINMILKSTGNPIIDVEEGTILYWLELAIEIAVILVAAWKNNSVSQKALRADEFLNQLRNESEENDYE